MLFDQAKQNKAKQQTMTWYTNVKVLLTAAQLWSCMSAVNDLIDHIHLLH